MLPLAVLSWMTWRASRPENQVDYTTMSDADLLEEMSWCYSAEDAEAWAKCSAEMARRFVAKVQNQ